MATKKKTTTKRRADHVVLFTGFPGFIGARLIPRLLELRPETHFVCLVQDRFLPAARDSVKALAKKHPGLASRMEMVVGDITAAGLGLAEDDAARVQKRLTGCYHLAAVYDLAVKRPIGMRINVEGTRNVVDFLQGCPK